MKNYKKYLKKRITTNSGSGEKTFLDRSDDHSYLPKEDATLGKENEIYLEYFGEADQLLRTASFSERTVSDEEIEAAWNKQLRISERSTRRVHLVKTYLTAAVVSLLLVALVSIVYTSQFAENNVGGELVKKETQPGQKLKTILPDGTSVILNSSSTLTYDSELLQGNERMVSLSGEALFDVKHMPDKPFRLLCEGVEVRVLGTTFGVRAYVDSEKLAVGLLSGRVEVTTESGDFELRPGHLLETNRRTKHAVVRPLSNDSFTSWAEGILEFNMASFEEAIPVLERWFGVTIATAFDEPFTDNLKVHGKFKGKSLTYVLDQLSYPDLFDYEINDRHVTIMPMK